MKAYGIASVLKEHCLFPNLKSIARKFPGAPQKVFNVQNPRIIDMVVDSDPLNFLPKCNKRIHCKSCMGSLCCYESLFSHGWVTVGQYNRISINKYCSSNFLVCLQK